MVFADSVDRSIVDKQLQKDVQVELVERLLESFQVFREPDLVLHVLDLFVSGVKAHTSHHVSNRLKRHLSIKLSGLGGMSSFDRI